MVAQSKPIKVRYKRPYLFDYQTKILDDPARFVFVEGATKVGKTSPLIVWLFEQALNGKRGEHFWWVAPIYSQAEIAFNRMQLFCKITQGSTGKPFLTPNIAKLRLTTPAGAVIEFKSADDPNGLYGENVSAFVLDEGSRAPEGVWEALLSVTTDTGGPGRMIANVVGRNWYWKLAQMAKSGIDPDYAYYKVNCWDAVATGNLSRAEVEAAKNELDPKVYKRLHAYSRYREKYPTRNPVRLRLKTILQAKRQTSPEGFKQLFEAEASEDGTNPFGQKNIEEAKRPLSKYPPVCFGIDLASQTDYTVVIGLDMFCQVCYIARYQLDWPLTKAILSRIPDLPIGIDATGVGGPVVADLQLTREKMEAFVFTPASKQKIMLGLATAFQLKQVGILEDKKGTDGEVLYNELSAFEFIFTGRGGIRYTAPPGRHDDTVCALALAVEQWSKIPKVKSGPAKAKSYQTGKSEAF